MITFHIVDRRTGRVVGAREVSITAPLMTVENIGAQCDEYGYDLVIARVRP